MAFPIFSEDGETRMPLTWDTTYVMNATAGTASNIIEVVGFSVRDIFSGQVEPHADWDGFEAYRVHHSSKLIRIAGIIRKPTRAEAVEEMVTMAGRFNPAYLFANAPTSAGFSLLQWTDDDGLENYYEARPLSSPDLVNNIFQGANIPFTIDLLAKPVRKVGSVSATMSNGAVIANNGDTIGYPVFERTLSGAGPTWTLTNSREPTKSVTLTLSSLSSGTVRVDMEKKEVTHNGSPIDHLMTSGSFWGLWPGNNTITSTGFTNNVTLSRYQKYMSK